ncbi:MAG: acyltransferase family protein [Alphaproteobacteria bacterium]|nr:acyltransferase family protein [Alphaproteobacteria bacterium]
MKGVGGGERYHALDAVRGGVLILGVFFHATLSFLPGQQMWMVMDASRSVELSVLFFALHTFRMTVFFVLAGFFGRLLLERLGVGAFVMNRAKRIAMPLAMFWPIVLTAFIAVLIWAAVQANGGVAPEGPPPPPLTVETFPLLHLWFLYVLLIFYAAALLLRGVVHLIDRKGTMRSGLVDPAVRFLTGFSAPVLLAIPVAVALYFKPNWMMWFGIPTPDTGLVPNTAALVAYGLAFGFGWLINRQPQILQRWSERWALYLVPAIGATAAALILAGGPVPVLAMAEPGVKSAGVGALYGFASWAWTIAIIGFAMRHLAGHSPARRYLADASYWIYIVHLPILIALQTLIAPYQWPWFAKYPLILAVAFVIMLASYQLIVRYSWIGSILNGKKQKPSKVKRGAPQLAAAE